MVWEITAKDAQYFQSKNAVVVREPHMTIYSDGARQTHVSGAEGQLTLVEREVQTLTLTGGVVVQTDTLRLETAEATYDRSRDLITAPGAVTVRGQQLDVRGQGMEVDVGPQHFRLLQDVHTIVQQGKGHDATS